LALRACWRSAEGDQFTIASDNSPALHLTIQGYNFPREKLLARPRAAASRKDHRPSACRCRGTQSVRRCAGLPPSRSAAFLQGTAGKRLAHGARFVGARHTAGVQKFRIREPEIEALGLHVSARLRRRRSLSALSPDRAEAHSKGTESARSARLRAVSGAPITNNQAFREACRITP
jgi:hypothetical protein